MSGSRWLSALGAALIAFGTATGVGDVISVKVALLLTALGGALGVFTERLQGGVSKPEVRAEAAAKDFSSE